MSLRTLTWMAGSVFFWNLVCACGQVTLPDFLAGNATYSASDGYWDDPSLWTGTSPSINGGLPARQMDCAITGTSVVARVDNSQVVSSAKVGFYLGDSAILNVDGSSADLVALCKLRLGEYGYLRSGGDSTASAIGRLYVKNGAKVRGCDLCVGPLISQRDVAYTGASEGYARVFSGRLAFQRILIAGGVKSRGTLEINGTAAGSVEVHDYLQMGTAETLSSSDGDTTSTLSFVLDSQGVTPITIHNSTTDGGLRLDLNNPAAMESKNLRKLKITLASNCEPPSGNITLVRCFRPIRGHFYNLDPSVNDLHVTATSSSQAEYRWTLTYTGGEGNDLVLTNPEVKNGSTWESYTGGLPAKTDFTLDPTLWDFPAPPNVTFTGTKAFPTAEGFGSYSQGGRGGTVYHVTTLEDLDGSGHAVAGSLRAAVEASGARTVVFDVGGTIQLDAKLKIANPYLTLAGQTAPGSGICVIGNNVILDNTHDIVIRYMRFRPGSEAPIGDALSIYSSYNCIVDHCSLSWSTDELLSITGLADLCTVQWCILAEGLNEDDHAYLSILGGERSTWHHNLIAHCANRVPKFYGVCRVDWRDNLVYNWIGSGYGEFAGAHIVNNWYKCGANTTTANRKFHNGRTVVKEEGLFLQHNAMAEQNAGSQTRILIGTISDNPQDGSTATGDNWNGMGEMDEACRAASEAAALSRPYTLSDDTYALHAYSIVKGYAGDNKNNGAIVQDDTDARIVDEFLNGTGTLKDTPPDDDPIDDYTGSAPTDSTNDTDRDGMPDSWEYSHTSPHSNTSLDPNADRNSDGYTNLEEYLNSLVTSNH